MNKSTPKLLLTALTALLLSACSSDDKTEAVSDNVIRFDTSVGGINTRYTRATITSETFNAFNVTALGSSAAYFQDLGVTKQTDGSWQTASTKYWPSYPLSFYAYAPASLQAQTSITTSAQKITGFKPATKPKDQLDVITAYVLANQNSNGGTAVLDFKHALSQIEVLAKNGAPDKYTVTVLGIKIAQIPSTADLIFQTANDAYPTWSTATGNESYIIKGTTALTLDGTARSIMFGTDNFLMIPQTLTAWSGTATNNGGAYLSVLCRITDELGNLIYPSDPTKYGFAALPVTQTWNAGHKVTYTISFFTNGGGAGLIDPVPTNPEDPNDPDVDPNPGGGGKGPGDLVTPDSETPISVSVNITDWLSGADDQIDMEF
ncbi:MAG: fimbrillin family protein [Prevotella sp.]|nr:fimbrillin family protein [Prevotella sp.]